MEYLYGLDALLGIVVSLATLIGFLTMRRGTGMAQTTETASASHVRKRGGFPLLKTLIVIGLAVGGWAYMRTSANNQGGWSDRQSGVSRYDRADRRIWLERRERREKRRAAW